MSSPARSRRDPSPVVITVRGGAHGISLYLTHGSQREHYILPTSDARTLIYELHREVMAALRDGAEA